MLGIFAIICLTIYILLSIKINLLLNKGTDRKIKLALDPRRYEVCQKATPLILASQIILLIGWIGCFWPFWFIEGLETEKYTLVIFFGIAPVLAITFAIYLTLRGSDGYISISSEQIECRNRKHFSILACDIKKIRNPGNGVYRIYPMQKGAKPFDLYINRFGRRKEIRSLIKQLAKQIEIETERGKTFYQKMASHNSKMFRLFLAIYFTPILLTKNFFKIYLIAFKALAVLLLVYTSWCCIEYDFSKKDYTEAYNKLRAVSGKKENAWDYYIKASSEYVELEKELQEIINQQIRTSQLDLDQQQILKLKKWHKDNTSAFDSFKKAASIDYCNQYYANIPTFGKSLAESSSPEYYVSLSSVKNFYNNLGACRQLSISRFHWTELFEMQLVSSKRLTEGKSLIDQLVGYYLLTNTIKIISTEDSLNNADLEKTRQLLQKNFPEGIFPLSLDGAILTACASYEELINETIKIPVQTPLNPVLTIFGSVNRAETYIQNDNTYKLEMAYDGIEPYKGFPELITLPLAVGVYCEINSPAWDPVCSLNLRADSYISAGYVVIDIEKYKLRNGKYPAKLTDLNLSSELPKDPHSESKIVYRLEENRAVLYSIGENAIDDGGIKGKGSKRNLDDVIYWERTF